MELPLRSRQVVLLRYLGDLTFGEIGKALSMPENTAKTIFQRAKVRLKRDLQARL
jgi:RNA polymerase sigma-70 factor (ECF subfamily)